MTMADLFLVVSAVLVSSILLPSYPYFHQASLFCYHFQSLPAQYLGCYYLSVLEQDYYCLALSVVEDRPIEDTERVH
jgi:hypothetical protein